MIESQQTQDYDLCLHHSQSRSQRQHELEREEGTKGTANYEKTGCFQCDGYNRNCPAYVSQRMLDNRKNKSD